MDNIDLAPIQPLIRQLEELLGIVYGGNEKKRQVLIYHYLQH